ncbi:MAG: hypothetical protein AB8G96_02440 [Phycisphaerales bacterium]
MSPRTLRRPLARGAAALIVCSASLSLGGCLIGSSRSITESGTRVPVSLLDSVEPGVTTESWVLATLGDPTSVTDVEDQPGTRILRYDYARRESSGGYLFLVFAGSTNRKTEEARWFEVTDGVVTRTWGEARG